MTRPPSPGLEQIAEWQRLADDLRAAQAAYCESPTSGNGHAAVIAHNALKAIGGEAVPALLAALAAEREAVEHLKAEIERLKNVAALGEYAP